MGFNILHNTDGNVCTEKKKKTQQEFPLQFSHIVLLHYKSAAGLSSLTRSINVH